jgi:hypothetical protein
MEMATRRNDAKEKMRLELKAIIKKNNEAFQGEFAEEIKGLLGLSRDEIDAITPDVTDLAVYAALIEVVKDASRKNVSQAELKARIRGLGNVAVEIAKKVGPLAKLLA